MSKSNSPPSEEWRPVVGYEGMYSVSSHGRVRSEERMVGREGTHPMHVMQKILSPATKRTGHKTVPLYNGSVKRLHVHRLMMLAFVGPPPSEKHQVAHNDGDATNNTLNNLRWATCSENFMDKVPHGTHNRGERHPLCKLTDDAVRDIRSSGMTNAALAQKYGVDAKHVWAVRARKTRNFV